MGTEHNFRLVEGSCALVTLGFDCINYDKTLAMPDANRSCTLRAGQLACQSQAVRVNGDLPGGATFRTKSIGAPCVEAQIAASKADDRLMHFIQSVEGTYDEQP